VALARIKQAAATRTDRPIIFPGGFDAHDVVLRIAV
jgi:hypothetical protein